MSPTCRGTLFLVSEIFRKWKVGTGSGDEDIYKMDEMKFVKFETCSNQYKSYKPGTLRIMFSERLYEKVLSSNARKR